MANDEHDTLAVTKRGAHYRPRAVRTRDEVLADLSLVASVWHYVPDQSPDLSILREMVREGIVVTQPGVAWQDAVCFQRVREAKDNHVRDA